MSKLHVDGQIYRAESNFFKCKGLVAFGTFKSWFFRYRCFSNSFQCYTAGCLGGGLGLGRAAAKTATAGCWDWGGGLGQYWAAATLCLPSVPFAVGGFLGNESFSHFHPSTITLKKKKKIKNDFEIEPDSYIPCFVIFRYLFRK
jgi:hypothetical protein